jgi:diacylglycerol O-acyltransferase
MEQLSGLDAAFVHQDSYRTPMHICAVLLYDTGEDDEHAISLAELKRLAGERLAQFPLFRRKLRRVPMGMDTPYWIDIARPNWGRHVSESILPGADGWEELQLYLARLHGARMDLAQPLWEMHLIHGLRDMPGLPCNCQALVLTIHHSAIDGISMAAIISALHQTPDETPRAKTRQLKPPSPGEFWARANLNRLNRQFKLAGTVRNLLPGVVRVLETRQQFSDMPPVSGTRSYFNAAVKSGRSAGAGLLPLAGVVAVKRAVRRVTLNDIALCCVAGAMRQYLLFHHKLPARSLAARVPINLRSSGDEEAGGNKIATMVVGLATNMADPVERLRMVHRYAVAGKKQINALGSGTVMDISDSLTPGVLAEGIRTMA